MKTHTRLVENHFNFDPKFIFMKQIQRQQRAPAVDQSMHAYTCTRGQCTIVLTLNFEDFDAFLRRFVEPEIVFLPSDLVIQLDNHPLGMDLVGLFISNMDNKFRPRSLPVLSPGLSTLGSQNSKTAESIPGMMIAAVLNTAVLKFMQALHTADQEIYF